MDPDAAMVCLMFYNWNEEILSADLELSVSEATKRCGYLREKGSKDSAKLVSFCSIYINLNV